MKFVENEAEFRALTSRIGRQVLLDRRLPDWPFRSRGFVHLYDYDDSIARPFGWVAEQLSSAYGDEWVEALVVDPPADRFARHLPGLFPAFRIQGPDLQAQWIDAISRVPNGDMAWELIFASNKHAVIGASGKWAVWGQRDWDVALLLTPDKDGPWRHGPERWLPMDRDLLGDEFWTAPPWRDHINPVSIATFWRNVHEHEPD